VFTLNNTSDVEINIYNSLGQSLGKQRISDIQNDLFTVNLSDKPDGIYFVEITSGKEKTTKKVIVTK
jgi:hypothetical protein